LLEKKYLGKLDARGSEYLGFCIEGAQRMEQLISGLLAWSQAARASDSAAQIVNIADVLETVTKNLSTAIGDSRAEIVASNLPSIVADPVPLVHLFQNLVSNALKYRGAERPRVAIEATESRGYWVFSVADNGIGIPKQFQSQIFGIFKRLHDRTTYPGTGIGLAICQKIVERSGGRIWVESEPGEGSTFFFTLPRASHDNPVG
jgi:light-regulated signal transduction histidine kinase (bacteriophytochrome)